MKDTHELFKRKERDLARFRAGLRALQLARRPPRPRCEVRDAAPAAACNSTGAEAPATSSNPAEPAGQQERRRWARRRGNPVSVRIHGGRAGSPIDAWVIDRSSGGVCLLVDEEVLVGADLEVCAGETARPVAV